MRFLHFCFATVTLLLLLNFRVYAATEGSPHEIRLRRRVNEPPGQPLGEEKPTVTGAGKTPYRQFRDEELRQILSDEELKEFKRLLSGSNEYHKWTYRVKKIRKDGGEPTPWQLERISTMKPIYAEYQRMVRAIKKKLIEKGVARPELIERTERALQKKKEYDAARFRDLPEEELEQWRARWRQRYRNRSPEQRKRAREAAARVREERRADSARMEELEAKIAADEALTPEEEDEVRALVAKRNRINGEANERYEKNNEEGGPSRANRNRRVIKRKKKGDTPGKSNPSDEPPPNRLQSQMIRPISRHSRSDDTYRSTRQQVQSVSKPLGADDKHTIWDTVRDQWRKMPWKKYFSPDTTSPQHTRRRGGGGVRLRARPLRPI